MDADYVEIHAPKVDDLDSDLQTVNYEREENEKKIKVVVNNGRYKCHCEKGHCLGTIIDGKIKVGDGLGVYKNYIYCKKTLEISGSCKFSCLVEFHHQTDLGMIVVPENLSPSKFKIEIDSCSITIIPNFQSTCLEKGEILCRLVIALNVTDHIHFS